MIFVECQADETVVRALGFRGGDIEHAFDKGRVCRRLMGSRGSKGLVDEDPQSGQPGYMERMEVLRDEKAGAAGLQVRLDRGRDNRLVVVRPRLEDWLLQPEELKAKFGESGFPTQPARLHKVIGGDSRRLGDLIREMKDRCPRLRTLAEYLGA